MTQGPNKADALGGVWCHGRDEAHAPPCGGTLTLREFSSLETVVLVEVKIKRVSGADKCSAPRLAWNAAQLLLWSCDHSPLVDWISDPNVSITQVVALTVLGTADSYRRCST